MVSPRRPTIRARPPDADERLPFSIRRSTETVSADTAKSSSVRKERLFSNASKTANSFADLRRAKSKRKRRAQRRSTRKRARPLRKPSPTPEAVVQPSAEDIRKKSSTGLGAYKKIPTAGIPVSDRVAIRVLR